VENSKARREHGGATALEVFWQGTLTTRELPADANYVEVEAPCPDGCSWEIREVTDQEIAEEGKAEGTLVCFLKHEGVDVSTFFTSGLEMTVWLPAGSPIVLTFR
jgi:hypothetical protein